MTELAFQAVNDAYQPIRETAQRLREKLRSTGLCELEAIHLVNRFVSGKFPDGRERVLAQTPAVAPMLDEIDKHTKHYEAVLRQAGRT